MNWRVKPLDAITARAEKKSLHRSIGGFQLTMLGGLAAIQPYGQNRSVDFRVKLPVTCHSSVHCVAALLKINAPQTYATRKRLIFDEIPCLSQDSPSVQKSNVPQNALGAYRTCAVGGIAHGFLGI